MDRNSIRNVNINFKRQVSPTRSVASDGQLKLTGSQVNLVSRTQINLRSPHRKSRPSSALPSYESLLDFKSNWKRPMSADNDNLKTRFSTSSLNRLRPDADLEDDLDDEKLAEKVSNLRSSYTVSSSRLLRSLLGEPWNSECSETSSTTSTSEKSLGKRIQEMAQANSDETSVDEKEQNSLNKLAVETTDSDFTKSQGSSRTESTICVQDLNKGIMKPPIKVKITQKDDENKENDETLDMKFQRWFPHSGREDEKTVRFSEEKNGKLLESESDEDDLIDFQFRTREDKKFDEISAQSLPNLDFSDQKTAVGFQDDFQIPEKNYRQEIVSPKIQYEILAHSEPKNSEICNYREEIPERDEVKNMQESPKTPVLIDLTEENTQEKICTRTCPFSCCQNDKKPEAGEDFSKKSDKAIQNDELMVVTPRDSTYDDIVSILHVLEQEEAESLLDDNGKLEFEQESEPECGIRVILDKKDEQLKDIYSYLDEVERCSEQAIDTAKTTNVDSLKTTTRSSYLNFSSVPRLEELLNKNTVELAHEVLTLRLQIEDQSSGIKLLQQTIAEMKEQAKQTSIEYQDALCKANTDTEAALQRHQKFIKQLLNEKKTLNEKVSGLVEELKSNEERYQRNLKAVEERHSIEIQRVKETQAAAEKLKREKWIDTKTQKIKEMTVKGLEPELARMAARQQQEMTELRNLHRAELEAVELRATRRTTELLDQLRAELAKDKEDAIQRECAALRAKLEKQMEEEQNNMQHQVKRAKEELRREKERIALHEAQMQDSLMESKRAFEREKERETQRMIQEFQEKMEAAQRRHQNEMKSLRDTLEIEKEAWMNNYKKQQTTKFLEREAELHHQYKRERDRDIELVIERLENEATQARLELNQAAENKLRRLREKLESELKEVEASEAALKTKLSEAKSQIIEKDDQIVELKSQIRHFHTEMAQLKKLCEEMSAERSDLREIIRKEFENQLSEAVKEIELVKNEMSAMKTNQVLELARRDQLAIQAKAEAQRELNQVYNRVKMTVSKKEEALEILRDQHRAALERCSHLEQMLENQRRNLLLK